MAENKPNKPGYKTTEFIALVAYAAFTMLTDAGVDPDSANKAVNALPDLIDKYLGKNPLGLVVLGVIIIYYIHNRSKIKTTEMLAEARKQKVVPPPAAKAMIEKE